MIMLKTVFDVFIVLAIGIIGSEVAYKTLVDKKRPLKDFYGGNLSFVIKALSTETDNVKINKMKRHALVTRKLRSSEWLMVVEDAMTSIQEVQVSRFKQEK